MKENYSTPSASSIKEVTRLDDIISNLKTETIAKCAPFDDIHNKPLSKTVEAQKPKYKESAGDDKKSLSKEELAEMGYKELDSVTDNMHEIEFLSGSTATHVMLKKEGLPDMRFKSNKTIFESEKTVAGEGEIKNKSPLEKEIIEFLRKRYAKMH